jgi:predicted Ser/Thr protein kinase
MSSNDTSPAILTPASGGVSAGEQIAGAILAHLGLSARYLGRFLHMLEADRHDSETQTRQFVRLGILDPSIETALENTKGLNIESVVAECLRVEMLPAMRERVLFYQPGSSANRPAATDVPEANAGLKEALDQTTDMVHDTNRRGANLVPAKDAPAPVVAPAAGEAELAESADSFADLGLLPPGEPGWGSKFPKCRLPEPGDQLGCCVVTERIAQGTFGIVYRGRHSTLNVPVAIKVLNPDILRREPTAAQELRTEALLLAQLNHPHIVRVWHYDDSKPPPYIVLEYVEGLNLAQVLDRRGRLPADRAIRLMLQIIDGMGAAAKLGIVHRDLKPANILLTADDQAKIADLGLATVIARHRELGFDEKNLVDEAAGGPVGTLAYISPEQANQTEIVDHRSDIYSLGATFYHMVAGGVPFPSKSHLQVLMKHMTENPTPPHEVVPGLPKPLSAVILRMMEKDPEKRFTGYDELHDALIDLEILLQSYSSGVRREDSANAPPPAEPAPPASPRATSFLKSLFGRKRPT